MKYPFGALLAAALITAASALPAADTPLPSDEEAPATDAQRAALEKSAVASANDAQRAIEAANPKHLPAFPGAEGFGALATGGRGGAVYHVTNLHDAGPGSFRDAVSQPNRIVVFDVGGIIKITKEIQVSSNLTIAGQSAPGGGICIYGSGVSLGGQSNIIVRFLRFREGIAGDKGKKALGMDKASNIIIDHCSIEWGRWDDLGITVGSTAITIQNCIVAEGIHPQSFGALIDTVTNITLSHNLWMSNESRNPKAKGTIQSLPRCHQQLFHQRPLLQ
jgi:pectate lyase